MSVSSPQNERCQSKGRLFVFPGFRNQKTLQTLKRKWSLSIKKLTKMLAKHVSLNIQVVLFTNFLISSDDIETFHYYLPNCSRRSGMKANISMSK